MVNKKWELSSHEQIHFKQIASYTKVVIEFMTTRHQLEAKNTKVKAENMKSDYGREYKAQEQNPESRN